MALVIGCVVCALPCALLRFLAASIALVPQVDASHVLLDALQLLGDRLWQLGLALLLPRACLLWLELGKWSEACVRDFMRTLHHGFRTSECLRPPGVATASYALPATPFAIFVVAFGRPHCLDHTPRMDMLGPCAATNGKVRGFVLIQADAADTVGHVANELVNLSSLTSQLTY